MNSIKVSIIIPVYKIPEIDLKKCIESCRRQTLKEIEIILVDDGSPDNCGNICDEYAKKDDRIKVIHKKNEGVSSARNLGILKARGKYIGFVDADDWIENDFYEKIINFGEKNQLDIVISGFVKNKDDKILEVLKKDTNRIFNKTEALRALLAKEIYDWSPWDKVYKKDIIIKNNIFFDVNIHMGEDLDFVWRIFNKTDNIGYISLNKYHYCYRENSAVTNKNPKKKISSILIMKKILDEVKNVDNDLYKRIQELYLKELASCCRDMLCYYENKKEIKVFQKEIRKNINAVFRNRDFKLKIKIAIIFFSFPYNICNFFRFLLK